MAKPKKRVAGSGKSYGLNKKPKCLVTFFSRTGTTKRLADSISIVLKADQEEIREPSGRSGILGYLRSGIEAAKNDLPKILMPLKSPDNYDITIIGTPIWSNTLSSPVRSYIHENKKKFKKVAFFCSCTIPKSIAFKEMEKICGKKPLATLELTTHEIQKGGYIQKINEFSRKLREKRHI